jgi:hypothetical protein
MKQVITGCVCALMTAGVVASAQDAGVTTETKVKSDNGKVVTMTGCVMIGGGTSFMLANITSEHERGEKASAHRGGPYALIPREGLDIGPYVNQRVELTGVVVPAATKGDRDDKIEIRETTRVDVANGPDKKSSAKTTARIARGVTSQFLVAAAKMVSPHCTP